MFNLSKKKKEIKDLIENQNLKEKDKDTYLNLLEEFFLNNKIEKNTKYTNLNEDELLFELVIDYLEYLKNNLTIYKSKNSSELSPFNISDRISYSSQYSSFSSFSNKVFKSLKKEENIKIDNFDEIKINLKFLFNKIDSTESEEKVVTLDNLLRNINY